MKAISRADFGIARIGAVKRFSVRRPESRGEVLT
jgi:hypothetical protein